MITSDHLVFECKYTLHTPLRLSPLLLSSPNPNLGILSLKLVAISCTSWSLVWRRAIACVASGCGRCRVSGLRKLSRGVFFGSSPSLRCSPVPLSSGLPQSSLSLWNAPRLCLLLRLLRGWVGPTAGAVILYLLSSPDVGGLPSISLPVCPLTHRPSPSKNPAFLC